MSICICECLNITTECVSVSLSQYAGLWLWSKCPVSLIPPICPAISPAHSLGRDFGDFWSLSRLGIGSLGFLVGAQWGALSLQQLGWVPWDTPVGAPWEL